MMLIAIILTRLRKGHYERSIRKSGDNNEKIVKE